MMSKDLKRKPSWFMSVDKCPHSGLAISHPETFVSSDPASDFNADMAKLGNGMILHKAYGYTTLSTGSEKVAFIDNFISRNFKSEIKIVFIEDYKDVTGADAESRKEYINYFNNNDLFIGMIVYQLSPFFKISFSLAKKFYKDASRAHAVHTYDQAIVLALNLIGQKNKSQKMDHDKKNISSNIENRTLDTSVGALLFGFLHQIFAKLKVSNVFFIQKVKQNLARQYSEGIIKYVATIDWQTPGMPQAEKILGDDGSSKKVFDAISFVKSEIDTLMEERNAAEAILRQSETRYRLLVEHAKAGFLEYDFTANRIIAVNDELMHMTGYSRQELLDMVPMDFLSRESQRKFKKRLAQFFSGESVPLEVVYQCIKKNGDIWWVMLNSNISYLNSRPEEASVVLTDITKMKQTENQLLKYQKKLKRLSIRLSMTEEDQRRSMASHLHETIGQELFVLLLQLNAFEKSIGNPTLLSTLSPIKEQLLKIIKETKTLTFDLSPPVLYDFGFQEALKALAETIELKHGIRVQPFFEGEMDNFDDEIKVIVYRNLKELIHNVVKHADAKNITMRLKSSSSGLNVELRDDGVGFDADNYIYETASHDGFGLFDIKEKLNHLGGHLVIDSAPGQGTSISMQVPVKSL